MNKYKKWLIGSILISAISFAIVTGLTFDSGTFEALKKVKIEYIFAAVLLHTFSFFVWSFRTQALCKALGYRVNFIKTIELVLSSSFVAGITPSSAGGEPVRIHMLYKNNVPLGKATAIVFGERLLDAFLIFAFLPLALYIFKGMFSNYSFDMAFLVVNLIVVLVLIFFVYGLLKPEKLKGAMHFVVIRFTPFFGKKTGAAVSHILERLDTEIDHFHDSILMFFSDGRKGLFYGIVYTFLFWVLEFCPLILILNGLNQHPSIILAFAAQILLSLVMIVPATPGSSGIAELGAASLFSVFVNSSLLGIAVIAWRTITYQLNLVLGGVVSLKVLKDMNN